MTSPVCGFLYCLTLRALAGRCLGGAGALADLGVRIEQGNHVTQGLLVSAHQRAQLLFEFQFFFQFVVLFQGLQALLKFLDGFFRGAIFVDQDMSGTLSVLSGGGGHVSRFNNSQGETVSKPR